MSHQSKLPIMGTIAAIFLSSHLVTGSPAAPTASMTPFVAQNEVCPPSVTQTHYPCCLDEFGQGDGCSASIVVTPSSVPTCQPCNFTYSVEISCPTCGSMEYDGQSGISCGQREDNVFACPDGAGNALVLKFNCGTCSINPEQQSSMFSLPKAQ